MADYEFVASGRLQHWMEPTEKRIVFDGPVDDLIDTRKAVKLNLLENDSPKRKLTLVVAEEDLFDVCLEAIAEILLVKEKPTVEQRELLEAVYKFENKRGGWNYSPELPANYREKTEIFHFERRLFVIKEEIRSLKSNLGAIDSIHAAILTQDFINSLEQEKSTLEMLIERMKGDKKIE